MFSEVRLTSQDGTFELALPERASRTSVRKTILRRCLLENYLTGGAAGGEWCRLLRLARWI